MHHLGQIWLILVVCAINWTYSLPTKDSTTHRYTLTDGHNTTNTTRLETIQTQHGHKKPRENFFSYSYKTLIKHVKYHFNRIYNFFSATKQPAALKSKNSTNETEPASREELELIAASILDNEDENSHIKTTKPPAQKVATVKKTVLTRIPLKNVSKKTTTKTVQINTQTKIRIKKTTTPKPIRKVTQQTKNWPNTKIQNQADLSRYKNYTKVTVNLKRVTKKPVVQKIISKWSEKPPYGDFKQSWYDHGIPIPNPNPSISSHSSSPQTPIESSTSNLLNTVALNISPDKAVSGLNNAINCPSIKLSSNLFGAKQGCADLNININTMINPGNNVNKDTVPIEDAAVEDPVVEYEEIPDDEIAGESISDEGVPLGTFPAADPVPLGAGAGAGNTVPAAAESGGSDGGGLTFLPGLPEFPPLPDILQFFRFLGGIWGVLSKLNFGFLTPILYGIPILSFAFGFFNVIKHVALLLGIPFFFLSSAKSKSAPKTEIIFHKHIHKPVHHGDGWFWNHNTKTWNNVVDYVHSRSFDNGDSSDQFGVLRLIEEFGVRYLERSQNLQSWKRRKRF